LPVEIGGWAEAALKRQARAGVISLSGSLVEVIACTVSIAPVRKARDRGILIVVGEGHRDRCHPPVSENLIADAYFRRPVRSALKSAS
jgi:hypothetical protein